MQAQHFQATIGQVDADGLMPAEVVALMQLGSATGRVRAAMTRPLRDRPPSVMGGTSAAVRSGLAGYLRQAAAHPAGPAGGEVGEIGGSLLDPLGDTLGRCHIVGRRCHVNSARSH